MYKRQVENISESIAAVSGSIDSGSFARFASAKFTWKYSPNTPSLKFENFHPPSGSVVCEEYPLCAASSSQSGVIAGTIDVYKRQHSHESILLHY